MKKFILLSFITSSLGSTDLPVNGDASASIAAAAAAIKASMQSAPGVVITQGGGNGFVLNGFSALGLVAGTVIVTHWATKRWMRDPHDAVRRDEYERFIERFKTLDRAVTSSVDKVEAIMGRVEVALAGQPAALQGALRDTGIIDRADALNAALSRLPGDMESAVERGLVKSGVRDEIVKLNSELAANSSRVAELNTSAHTTLERMMTLQCAIGVHAAKFDEHSARLDAHATKIESTQTTLHGMSGVLQGINATIMLINDKVGSRQRQ